MKLSSAVAASENAARRERHLTGNITERVHEAARTALAFKLIDIDKNPSGKIAVAEHGDFWIGQTARNFVFAVERQIGRNFAFRYQGFLRLYGMTRTVLGDLVDLALKGIALLFGELDRGDASNLPNLPGAISMQIFGAAF